MKNRPTFNDNQPNPSKLAKKQKIKEKLNITKDELDINDLTAVISKINVKLVSNDKNIKNLSKKIFSDLDKESKGRINTEAFIEEIILRNSSKKEEKDEELGNFYTIINQELSTKSENIISKLKRIKNQDWVSDDNKAINDIEWIITAISEKNLYDFDTSIITKHLHNKNKKRQSQFGFLVKYSQIEDQAQKEKDIRLLRKKSRFYIGINLPLPTTSGFGLNSNSSRGSNANLRRRSTNLSTLIAPSIIAKIYQQIQLIDTPEFDIFDLDNLLGKKTSIFIATEILFRFDFVDNTIIPSETLKLFINEIVTHYDREKAIYHNDLHAGDVMQTVFTIITKGDVERKGKLGQLDTFVILIAALCHDYKHPGVNNTYLINTKSKIATRYNDVSVLENYHIAQTFKVISKSSTNIFATFTPEEFRICRRRMVESILATDMANHQSVVSAVKVKIESLDVKNGKIFESVFNDEKNVSKLFESQQCMLNMILHTSDISNPAKPEKISDLWKERVYAEFFVQGDMEKSQSLAISNFCDRNTTNINKAMVGFITFVVMPTIEILVTLIPEVSVYKEYCKGNLRRHKLGALKDDKLKKKN